MTTIDMSPEYLTGGLYWLGEVTRLAGISTDISRRFVRSYKGRRGLWGGGEQRAGRYYYATFRDLMELRYVNAFHIAGVSWQRICRTAEYSRERFGTDYPFSHRRFQTDGAEIFSDTNDGLEQISRYGQMAFSQIIGPELYEPLDYVDDAPVRWYPAEEWGLADIGQGVMVDPLRSAGAPVTSELYIPTETLYSKFKAEENDADRVARWYEIPKRTVLGAVAFEEELVKRAARFTT